MSTGWNCEAGLVFGAGLRPRSGGCRAEPWVWTVVVLLPLLPLLVWVVVVRRVNVVAEARSEVGGEGRGRVCVAGSWLKRERRVG